MDNDLDPETFNGILPLLDRGNCKNLRQTPEIRTTVRRDELPWPKFAL